jgi:hypothetical protein
MIPEIDRARRDLSGTHQLHWNRSISESGTVLLKFPFFLGIFAQYFAFFLGKEGLGGEVMRGIGRARRDLLGTSDGYIGIGQEKRIWDRNTRIR